MDIDTLIAESDPARSLSLSGPDSAAAVRLYRQITGQIAPEPVTPGLLGRRRRRPIAAFAGAAAAGLAAAAIAVALPGPAGPTAVAAVLDRAAATAADQPAEPVFGAGQYLYAKTIRYFTSYVAIQGGPIRSRSWTVVQQVWFAQDGSGRMTMAPYTGQGAGPRGLNTHRTFRAGSSAASAFGVYLDDTNLPTDPAALERVIAHRFGGEEGNILNAVAGYLQAGASPELRAALYRVIKQLPGIQDFGPATDRLGRQGIAVGAITDGEKAELIFDPSTSALLEQESWTTTAQRLCPVATDNANGCRTVPAGTLISKTTYVTSGVANSDTVPPTGTTAASPSQ